MDEAKLLELITLYATLVDELSVAYYVQDNEAINDLQRQINTLHDELPFTWNEEEKRFIVNADHA